MKPNRLRNPAPEPVSSFRLGCRRNHRRRVRLSVLCTCAMVILAGCTPINEEQPRRRQQTRAPIVPYPAVERDLDEIRAQGVIRMITRYNSSNYFVHKGGEAGFEYELFSGFARENKLAVEVIIPESTEDLYSILNSGRGDVIAAGLSDDEHLSRYASFTRPYDFVHKVLVLPADDHRADTLPALHGLTIHLPAHSEFRTRLQEIRHEEGLHFFIATSRALVESEELIAMVSRGEIQATVADDNLARAALTYLPTVRIGLQLDDQRPLAWAVRENSPELKAALNSYLKQNFWVTTEGPRRSHMYGVIYERYYRDARQIRGFQAPAYRPDKSGRISPFDELIQAEAAASGLDWRMVAALIYQESLFDSQAVSNAGAVGLMQVLPRYARVEPDELTDPAVNIRAGVLLLRQIHREYAYLDSLERWRFTLATYHAGAGHMADVRRLVMDMGKNPNRWQDAVEIGLMRKMQRRHYSQTRHGFYRGAETIAYVQAILRRYRTYRRLLPQEHVTSSPAPGVHSPPPPPE